MTRNLRLVIGRAARVMIGPLLTKRSAAFVLLLSLCAMPPGQAVEGQTQTARTFIEKEVSLKTEDGWVIHGVLSLPPALAAGEKVAGVVLVPSPSH
ncbi:MAG TPA: hypothetical protein VNO14_13565, partial [Blastocatellia bacterium]|nr:hypothetical protein [Blastocatellia bacterium]